jgi:undecaprenyl-diphosphatase
MPADPCHHSAMVARPPLLLPLVAGAGFLVLLLLVVTDWTPLDLTGLVVGIALAAGRRRGAALFVAAVTAVVPALWGLAHWLLHHPRPLDGFVTVHSNGFPSGHTSNAATTALVGVLLLWPGATRTGRAVLVAAAVTFAVTVGVTRLALLAHWPADVLGGWLLALTVVPLAARWTGTGEHRAGEPGQHPPG